MLTGSYLIPQDGPRDTMGCFVQPALRQHFGEKLRDAGLDVADINTYMARFKPQPRSPTGKGHPEGPRVQPHVKPRLNPADMDNSLRTLDIEGTRWD